MDNNGQPYDVYNAPPPPSEPTKFCKHCGAKIPADAVICTVCGRQVEQLAGPQYQPNIVINNANTNTQANVGGFAYGREKNKWVALCLCFFLGYLGAHRFYEGKIGTAILYIFTGGLCGIGIIIDFITILLKPNPYYV